MSDKRISRILAAVVAAVAVCGAISVVTPAAPAAAATRPVVYLTFDDGPGVDTPDFLDLLGNYGVRATFFVTGRAVALDPNTTRRIVAEGHAIANHTWSHPRLTSLPAAGVRRELTSTSEIIRSTTGVTPTCYRPPYGATNASVHTQAVAVGLPNAQWRTGVPASHHGLWDIDTDDWRLSLATSTWTPSAMRARLDRVGDGDTVLMHDGFSSRSRGLAVLAGWLADNHQRFEFRTLPGCGGSVAEPALDPDRPQDWHRFQIARLYLAYFGRPPDDDGWEYWNRVRSQNNSLLAISGWFAESVELAHRGVGADADFVTMVYRQVLHREPDQPGHDYWVAQLGSGMERGELMVLFSQSEEFTATAAAVLAPDCLAGTIEATYACWASRLPAYTW